MFVTSRCSSYTEATVVCDQFIKISTGAGILMISDVMMTGTAALMIRTIKKILKTIKKEQQRKQYCDNIIIHFYAHI